MIDTGSNFEVQVPGLAGAGEGNTCIETEPSHVINIVIFCFCSTTPYSICISPTCKFSNENI